MLYGIDVSSFQTGIDLTAVAAGGFDFCFVKASEGSGYTNPAFTAQLNGARSAGLIVAAYHYQRPDPVAAQVDLISRTVPRNVPVVLDVESGSGDVGLTRALVAALRAAGYRVPLLYLPRWYWQQIGSPDLSGLPPLWSSRYPSANPAPASVLYQAVPQNYWDGYGGLPVSMLQFADSAQVAGRTVDANAFLGTRDELSALLGGGEVIDMTPEQDTMLRDVHEQLCGGGSRTSGAYQGWVTADGTGRNLTVVDLLREAHRELNMRLPSRVPGSTTTDTVLGYAANSDSYGYRLTQTIAGLVGKVDALTAALSHLATAPGAAIDLAAITKAAEDGARKVWVGATYTASGTFSPSSIPLTTPSK